MKSLNLHKGIGGEDVVIVISKDECNKLYCSSERKYYLFRMDAYALFTMLLNSLPGGVYDILCNRLQQYWTKCAKVDNEWYRCLDENCGWFGARPIVDIEDLLSGTKHVCPICGCPVGREKMK